ncbi:unnamed protein product [Thelazia callipaeda]|uniref:Titin n=1 Tax=Thelazia callipaeda TaxID=103827 RepID=A0A158RCU9_THECL|nr:unnamed protein product [Thelazia callipaeda]
MYFRTPSPEVIWLDTSGKPIPADSDRFKISTADQETRLTVLKIDSDVAGKYVLVLKNELGEAQCEIPLEVSIPFVPGRPVLQKQGINSISLQWTAIPTFIDNKTVKYIIEMKKEGKDEWMKVTVCNQPSVTINELEAQQFYRFRIFIGDEKLSKDEKEEVQIIKDELFISEKPSEFDALHELQPKIAEEEKRTRRERKKKLARTEIEFDSKLVDVTVNLGDSVELFVAVNSVHEPQVRWYRNEQVIDINDSRFIIKRENNRYGIKIISCEALDSGRWKVIAQNSDGQCESECQITVIKPADFTVPQFTKSLENIECEESSKVTLEVGVRANPKPQILWYFENIELYEKERYKLKADQVDGSYSFSIMPAIPKDSGVYRCIAKNIAGVAETYCNLTVNKRVRVTLDDKAPVFQMPLTDNEISEGCKMTLACAVTGTPNPSLQWFKNGKKLIDNDFVIKFERGLCTLTKDVVKLGDAGVYKCVAENMNGSSASECSVHIKPSGAINIKPYFKIPLTETSTISGSEVVLGCKVIGLPEPVITWYKDGQKLLFENRMLHCSYHNGNVRLNIMNVTANDSGEYLCEAVNAFGKDVSQCIVKVIDMASGSALERERESTSPTALEDETKAPVFTAPLHDVVFNEGSREILEVEVDAHPKPMIEWLLNGKLLQESSAIRSHFDGHLAILEISEVHSEHQGEVICRAVNKLGSAETRCSVLLDESKTFAEVPKIPEFCEKLRSIKVKNEGDTLTLKCKVIGQPEPEIQWLLNGKVIKTNAQKRIRTFDDGVSLLEILNITSESCGTYTALARNVYGDAHTSAEISLDGQVTTVMKKPFFVIEPRSYLVVEEDSVLSIVCGIDGKPEPEIYWFKEHSVISDDRVIIRKEGISHQIIISSVSSKDEGIYTIEAQNIGGKIRADIQVNVTPKEKLTVIEETGLLPPGKPFAAHLNKNSLLLQWEASNDKAKVEEYIIEQRRPDDQTWSVVGASRETQLLITGLQPNTEYVFRVAAKNKAGQGAYSSTSEVITTLPLGRKPTFESLPPTQIVLNEEDIELIAEYSGDPIPSVKWYYNGIEISSKMNNITVVKLSDRSSKLVIRNPKPIIHTGIYSCHIVNETGEAISETRIIQQVEVSTREEVFEEIQVEHLVGAPRVVKPLSNETTTTGQEFILTCEIQSCPKGVISWFKNDERLAPVGRYEMHEQDDICKLICHKAQSSDTGTYRCVLTNSVGFAQSTCSLTVLPRILQMAPKFEVLLEDRTALSGKDVKMKCQVTGNPEPQITWMRDGVLISTNRHQKLEFSEDGWCSLTIFNCTAEDTGLYLCTACNVVGSKSSQCMLTIVDISGPDKHLVTAEIKEALYCKPKFTRAPSAVVETVEGSMVKLTSRAIGQPTPIVKWFKDGKEVTLLHKQPDKEAPNFVVDLVDTGVAIGHPVTLKCVVKGIPEPELKWIFINDAQQTSLLRTTTNSLWTECRRGETCEMKTENVMKAQQGTYQCFASNEYGKALTQCYLLVGGIIHFICIL